MEELRERQGRSQIKGQAVRTTWPSSKAIREADYFEYVLLVPALVDIVSFFCAQAPRLNAPAATATIMMTFNSFILIIRPLSEQVAAVI